MHAQSALYECRVMHQRLAPKRHGFHYNVFYLWLDLDELPHWERALRLFSRNRFNLFSLHDRDHLGGGAEDLRSGLLGTLAASGVDTSHIAAVRLLAFPRVLGYGFNPVAFFFCLAADGAPLCAVAQVTNTFQEQKLFILPNPGMDGSFHLRAPKHFYVSPFSSLELSFDFRLETPADRLSILIDDVDADGNRVLVSSLTGRRRALSDAALLACALKYPLLTLRVIFLIHWHALRLWLKKLPVHRKAADPHLQTGVLRPHASLQSLKS